MLLSTLARRPRAGAARTSVLTAAATGLLAASFGLDVAGAARSAHATGGDPRRVAATSVSGPQPVKSATVSCPAQGRLFAAGGEVRYAGGAPGGVALTGMVPLADRRSAVVTAAASPLAQPGDWSVTAYAICDAAVAPVRVTAGGRGQAVAECPSGGRVFGLGFSVDQNPAGAHVVEVAPDPGLTRVRVAAGGPQADGTQVTAVVLCSASSSLRAQRTASNDAGWPKTAAWVDDDPYRNVYATGAAVESTAPASLDAIVPGLDGAPTWARGTLLAATAPAAGVAPARIASAGKGGGDGSVTTDAVLIGTFH